MSIDESIHKCLFEAVRNGIKPTHIELGDVKWQQFKAWLEATNMPTVKMVKEDPYFGEERYCGVLIRRAATPGITVR